MKSKIMAPIDIKYALEKAGYSQAQVAEMCKVSQSMVSRVISDQARSHRVRCQIAKLIGHPVGQIWNIKQDPRKTGRPLTRLGTQAA